MNTNQSFARRIANLFFNPHRFNDTAVYQLYVRVRYPGHFATLKLERAFYRDLIRLAGGGLVFDVGANGGAKAKIFTEKASQVVCVEPSPAAVCILRERFAKCKKVAIVEKGVGPRLGALSFHMFGDADCYNTFSLKWADQLSSEHVLNRRPVKRAERVIEVPVVTLDSLILEFGVPSYVKIDVEGFEVEVLKGLSQPINLISIECNLPEFESETLDCLERLDHIQPRAAFNYCTAEPPSNFVSERWLSLREMAEVVVAGNHPFMEIYCRAGK